VTLPATFAFDSPTARAISSHLLPALVAVAGSNGHGVSEKSAESTNDADRAHASDGRRSLAAGARSDVAVASGECLRAVDSPKVRLFCFHDAGGAATMFLPLATLARSHIEVHCISHARTDPTSDAHGQLYLEQAVTYITARAEQPFALLGHSLGALFAWRVAQELASQRAPQPALLLQSAPPSVELAKKLQVRDLDAAFASILGERARPVENLRHDFEADVELWQAIPVIADRLLDIPIGALVGAGDHVFSEADARTWELQTTDQFSLTVLPGGHFYLYQSGPQQLLLTELEQKLRAASAPDRTSPEHRSVTDLW
jgi:medium-chain acyl-[acyl-carrier-protein] hydrolase